MMQDKPALSQQDGILPAQDIHALISAGHIHLANPPADTQIQPASLDLRLGQRVWRVQASFLPGAGRKVSTALTSFAMHEIDLTAGAVLEKGCVYIAQLQESLDLPDDISGLANPKSSTGRLDVFTRLITDGGVEFEAVPAGYQGPLFAEISPRTFSILVRPGSRLSQLRLRRGRAQLDDVAHHALQQKEQLIRQQNDQQTAISVSDGIGLSVNLTPDDAGLIGWRARKHAGLVDVDKPASLPRDRFWEAVRAADLTAGGLVLNPDEFYILASREYVSVPAGYAAEMRAYDTRVGEFRAHYAGFFDPGFGLDALGAAETRAVLEVRSHDVPFLIEEGQIVCRLVYEPMARAPQTLYGSTELPSNYQAQGLKLAKHFISE
ncbi:MAG: 2'-deoxycytidine 5'-triphosphate deaminase [Candidatus Puniceispirillaceae bacterium]